MTIRLVNDELRPPQPPPRRHLLSVADLTRDDVERLLGTARTFEASMERELKKLPTLKGRLIVNLFYESSTRTSSSFELAAKRLSADTLNIKSVGSSVDKGESLKDTALTLGAYDPDVIVIRHPQIGAPQLVANVTDAHIVNAGDGKHQHPTQALLDLYTLQQELGRLEGLHVAIVGDILHSRVARSNMLLLPRLGARVILCGPTQLLPDSAADAGPGISVERHFESALRQSQVIMMLRIQAERLAGLQLDLTQYKDAYQLTGHRLSALAPTALVLHPGPIIRGLELTAGVADGAQSAILEQVRHGVAIRMAVVERALTAAGKEGRV
jgi:aspartate carbamoyltransferase catalytic subunit